MQKPLQLRTIVSRPVRALGLSPVLAARPQPQLRLHSLFAGECWWLPLPLAAADLCFMCLLNPQQMSVRELRAVTPVAMPPRSTWWLVVILWLLAQVDKLSHLFLSQKLLVEAGHSHAPQPYKHPAS